MSVNETSTAAAIWQAAAQRLREKFSPNIFEQWFAHLVPVRMDDDCLVLGVAEDFFGSWVQDYYGIDIEEALQDLDGRNYKYILEAGHLPEAAEPEKSVPALQDESKLAPVDTGENELFKLEPEVIAEKPAMPEDSSADRSDSRTDSKSAGDNMENLQMMNFNPQIISRFTFENFVVGEENRYAYTAARRAAECPGVFNPLYIYGNTGIGKTHLLHAISQQAMKLNPRMTVRYATCEEILNSFVESLQNHNYATFRSQLRNVDMLLVDDIHLLGRKGELQEQFFNAFNALYFENKQIVLTSDKRPSEIAGLEDRLISRFEQGVTTELYAPGLEVRIAILRGMQKEFMMKFDDEILEFIASRISSNVRRLRGALMRLLSRVSFEPGMPITLETVEDTLHQLFEEEHSARMITLDEIQKKVAEYFNLRLSDLLSNKRPKSIAEPRMVAMYLARKLTTNSFPQIGSAFGRNHATIMNAWSKVPELCEKDEELRRAVAVLERQLQS